MGECFFWYRPTRVILDQRPLNGCVCVRCVCTVCVCVCVCVCKNDNFYASVFTVIVSCYSCSVHGIHLPHTHPFYGPFSGTTWVSQYQKGKTNLDFTEARDSEWQWHQLGHMQICNSLQTDSHASTPSLSFLQAVCPSSRPTNSVKALKAID